MSLRGFSCAIIFTPLFADPSPTRHHIKEVWCMRFFEQVYILVQCIPPGRVATYGQIARLLGQPHAARTVGWALRGLPEGHDVPWHRVVNASGRISLSHPQGAVEQQHLLGAEGVVFDPEGGIDLSHFGWAGLPEHEIELLMTKSEDDYEPT
jgi:methylated-DNA-protein-cysteine methyltransferase-like protein